MSYASERIALENQFATSWATASSICWQNVAFEPPTHQAYVEFYVFPATARRQDINAAAPMYRHYGQIEIHVMIPVKQGVRPALLLADRALAIFRCQKIGTVVCRAGQVLESQIDDDNGEWLRTPVVVPYWRDEVG